MESGIGGSNSALVLCFSTLGNWRDLCRRAVAPRGRQVILPETPAAGRRPRTRRARAVGGAAAQLDAPRPLGMYPLSAHAWRGTHGGTHCHAPRRVTARFTRRHTAAAAACGGGDAPTRPSTGGARRHQRLDMLVLGGEARPCLWRAPPLLYTCRWGRQLAGRYKTGHAAAHCRASLGGSVHLFSRVDLPPASTRPLRRLKHREYCGQPLLYAAAPVPTCIGAGTRLCMHLRAFIQDPPWQRVRQLGDH